MAKTTLFIGDKNLSSWSMRAWLAAKHAGLDFEEVVIALRKPETKETVKKISPSGRVPALHHNGLVIWDSLAIAEYLAEEFPGSNLWPSEAKKRALARSICAEMHSGFQGLRSACPMNIRGQNLTHASSADLEENIRRIEAIWTECLAKNGGPFLFGRFGLADAFFAPVASRFYTYKIDVNDTCKKYMKAVWDQGFVREWVAAVTATSSPA
jgi:glutathione S-transferase